VYELITAGKLRSYYIGRAHRVSEQAFKNGFIGTPAFDALAKERRTLAIEREKAFCATLAVSHSNLRTG
jgi:hypothetical protein